MELYKRIAVIQASVGKLSKELENPFYKSRYFDINKLLEVLQPLFEDQNIICLQPIQDNCVKTVLINTDKPEEKIESSICLHDISDPQKVGSAITYYRRYTLVSLLGLQAEDDDGNKASGIGTPKKLDKTIADVAEEPTQWLNVTTKDNKPTPQWTNILKGIADGKITSVQDVRKFYKVSRDVAAIIEDNLKNV